MTAAFKANAETARRSLYRSVGLQPRKAALRSDTAGEPTDDRGEVEIPADGLHEPVAQTSTYLPAPARDAENRDSKVSLKTDRPEPGDQASGVVARLG